MQKRKTFRQKVWDKTISEVLGESVEKSVRNILYLVMFSFIMAIFRIKFFGIGEFMSYLNSFISEFMIVGIITFVVYFILVYIFRSPYLVGEEQQRKLNENEPIRIPKVTTSSFEEQNDSKEFYVYLLVNNGEEEDLEDCYADVKTLKVKMGNLWIDLADEHITKYNPNPNNVHLTFPAFRKEENKIIRKGKKGRVNIAKYSNGQYFLILEDGDKPIKRFEEFQYYIEVTFNAKMGNKVVEEKEFRGFFRYEKDNGLETTKFFLEQGELPKSINSLTDFLTTMQEVNLQ